MEIFAGAAMLTSMALNMGFEVAAPVDIKLDGSDLLKPSVRLEIEKEVERLDPYWCVICTSVRTMGPMESTEHGEEREDMPRHPPTKGFVVPMLANG